ncbi:hypothetical protein EVAR_95433_1 [Eumeta japonica]|uniref:Uncharacterized protein n=1 Tax=Eumeta variegata TaxID=151549 RepID=A0A4C1VJ22_EUMVA|nr:hypothetical protein EVAR_95433_1 [Eumeta japonica]
MGIEIEVHINRSVIEGWFDIETERGTGFEIKNQTRVKSETGIGMCRLAARLFWNRKRSIAILIDGDIGPDQCGDLNMCVYQNAYTLDLIVSQNLKLTNYVDRSEPGIGCAS